MKKSIKNILIIALLFMIVISLAGTASAASNVMWGKTELKAGQIGKVTVLEDSRLVKIEKNGSFTTVRTVKKGEEYRVYSYKGQDGGLYGVGGGSFVQKNIKVKYESPSKAKLALLKQMKEEFSAEVVENNTNTNNSTPTINTSTSNVKYKNCTEMRKVYPNGVKKGHSAYESKHDRDNDGQACEKN